MKKAKLYTTIASIVCAAALSGCIINIEQPKDVSPIIESTIKLTDAITVEIAKEPPKEGYELYYTPFDDIDFYPGFAGSIALHTPELQLIEHDEEAVAPEAEPEPKTSVWGLLLLRVMVQVMERFPVRKSVCTLHSFGATTKGYLIVEKESVSIQAHTKLAMVDVICFALTTTALFLFCNM